MGLVEDVNKMFKGISKATIWTCELCGKTITSDDRDIIEAEGFALARPFCDDPDGIGTYEAPCCLNCHYWVENHPGGM